MKRMTANERVRRIGCLLVVVIFCGAGRMSFGASETTASAQPRITDSEQRSVLHRLRTEALAGPYGSMPISELLRSLAQTPGGPEVQAMRQAVAIRKQEALAIVKDKLRTGDMWEKHTLTKFLQASPWPEVSEELVSLALSHDDHWLPRQGALYALGALGDPSVGPRVIEILTEPNCPSGVRLVAIATLGRINYQNAASAVRPFAQDKDIHTRLFANFALAQFGEPVEKAFLLSCLEDQDYLVREEACGALAAVDGEDIQEKLRLAAQDDFHEAVRVAARIALLERETKGESSGEKLDTLRNALKQADRRTAVWILRAILDKCGPEGQAFVEQQTGRSDAIGERAKAFLILLPRW